MQKNYTHIVMLLDRSGSMKSIQTDTIGGINQFIDTQKKVEGKATVTLIQFDDRYEPNYSVIPINEIEPLTEKTFVPRGWTRLHDAMGRAIISTGEGLNKLKEEDKPEKLVFVIMTDGKENDSKEFKQVDVANLVKQQTEQYNWQFVFLGANQNAILEAQKVGISRANAITYASNAGGVASATSSLGSNLVTYRTGATETMAWSDEQRQEQEKAGVSEKLSSKK